MKKNHCSKAKNNLNFNFFNVAAEKIKIFLILRNINIIFRIFLTVFADVMTGVSYLHKGV